MNPLIIDIFHVPVGLTVLNAGIILGLMAAPIMTSIAFRMYLRGKKKW